MYRKYTIVLFYFLMCPRRSYPNLKPKSDKDKENFPEFDNNKEYDPEKEVFPFYPHQHKPPPSQWVAKTIEGNENQVPRLDDSEPGFDLTAEEKEKFKIWPKGIINYYIDSFSFDKVFRDMIRLFLSKSGSLTGLRFVELQRAPPPQTRYLFFINRRGVLECQDYTTVNFTNKGVQRVVIGYDCFSDGLGPGALILALAGVPPMHKAPDRERYITFQQNNTNPDKVNLFDVLSDNEWLFHDITYDWHSAGHYFWHKYTSNGLATIVPKKEAPPNVGEYKELSYIDVWKIKMLYSYDTKKSAPVKKDQCNRLFKPGSKFAAYSPQSDDELTPRVKPNKYLGIADAVQEKPDDDEVKSVEENPEQSAELGQEKSAENDSNVGKINDFQTKNQKLYSKRSTARVDKSILTASDYNSSD